MSIGLDENSNTGAPAVVALNRWLEQVGVTPCTAWRWRRKGWLKTVNISGRQYLTEEAIDEFHRRAVAGEFAQEHKVPSRKEAMNQFLLGKFACPSRTSDSQAKQPKTKGVTNVT